EAADAWERGSEARTLLAAVTTTDWRVRLACLLWPETGGEAGAIHRAIASIRARWKISNDESDALRRMLRAQGVLDRADRRPWSAVQPTLSGPYGREAVELFAARAGGYSDRQATLAWLHQRLDAAPEVLDPPPLLDGGDLIDIGMRPGPRF